MANLFNALLYIIAYIIFNSPVIGRIHGKGSNLPQVCMGPLPLQKAFLGTGKRKITEPTPHKGQQSYIPNKGTLLQKLLTEDTRKVVVVACGTALFTAACYRYVSKLISYHLYDKYVSKDAPGISEVLGHVLFAKDPPMDPKSTPLMDKLFNSISSALCKIGWIRGLYKPGIRRVPISSAIDEDTVTALYFHSSNIDKLLNEQGFVEFTPKLKKIYESMKSSGRKLQVVYVNLDQSPADAVDHFNEMPWYAIPFCDKRRILDLCKLYDITSVPSIVLLDSSGNVLNDRALYVMLNRPNDYPWRIHNIFDMVPDTLVNGNNQNVSKNRLGGKIVGLYFGAGWTKNNRDFSAKLADFYTSVNKKTDDRFEIVYVSNDRNAEEFEKELSDTNSLWLSTKYQDGNCRTLLQHYLNVQTLPSLIILDPNGNIITRDGSFYVETDRNAEILPYKSYLYNHGKQKVEDIANNIDGFAHHPVLIVFADTLDQRVQEELEIQLNEAATKHSNNRIGREIKFFISKEPHKRTDAIRKICGLKKTDRPQVVILDLIRHGVYYDPKMSEITQNSILNLVCDYYKGKLKTRRISLP